VPVHRASSSPLTVLVLLAAVAVLLAGCRLEVAGDLTIARDGAATAEVSLSLDEAALAELDALAVDPTAELAAVAGEVTGWQVTRESPEDGGLTIRLSRTTADAQGAADAFRDLSAGLAEGDPVLLVDLDVQVDDEGAVRLAGTAGFRPPSTAGASVDGEPVGPDAEELAELTAAAVQASFRVTTPGAIVEHDADQVDGRTATWDLAVGDPRPVRAVSDAPTGVPVEVLVAAAGLLGAVLLAVAVWWWRRRRRGR
jgi:hypothetical protein